MESNLFLSPIIQYGFAGMCAVQMAFIAWLVGKLMRAFERNTIAYHDLISMLKTRPCLTNDRVFMERHEGNR